jgi:hypothetical protein
MASRASVHFGGIWEVVGVLAVVVPCGVLAGLYLATSDPMFLVVCGVIAIVAAGILLFRKPVRRPATRRRNVGATARAGGAGRLGAVRSALGRTFTLRILKLLALVGWLLAWGVLAVLYAKVAENVNIAALAMLVVVGGFSPLVIYFGLEAGVQKLSRRIDPEDPD